MPSTLYRRLYYRLCDLIPDLAHPVEGAAFCAPPRVDGDLTLYCAISNVSGALCDVEIAQGALLNECGQPVQCMVFRVDVQAGFAELLTLEDQWRYEAAYSEGNTPNPRRAQMNVFAVNSLTAMLNLGGAFRPLCVRERADAPS